MSTVCEACGTSNRATAMFCIGCAQRLPAFVSSGPSALETMGVTSAVTQGTRASADRPDGAPASAGRDRTAASTSARRDRAGAPWLPLGILMLTLLVGFSLWRFYGQLPNRAGPAPEAPLVALTPAPLAAPSPAAVVEAPSPPPRGPEPLVAAASGVDAAVPVPGASSPSPAPKEWFERAETITEPASAVPSRPAAGGGTAVQAATTFYRALSAGDGATAAALITPSKRGVGPFAAERMSSFYGSFRQPLSVQSIRPLEPNAVEVRYTYRASRSVCAGVAVVHTEQVMQQTVIRSISANC
jgi:hypothetical protein